VPLAAARRCRPDSTADTRLRAKSAVALLLAFAAFFREFEDDLIVDANKYLILNDISRN
jgi:hypothetical protein